MGVLNITPDSFFDGGRLLASNKPDLPRVMDAARGMLTEGAAILDVGGESTRPGADPISIDDECHRVIPVLECLLELDAIVSIDTCKAEVAARAVALGCQLVNDVCGLQNPDMLQLVADSDAAVCIMHMQGEPRAMQNAPQYRDVVADVRSFLERQVAMSRAAGIDDERILLDPGFGFGKTTEHNLTLLRRLSDLDVDGLPLLVGLSRKSTIGNITNRLVDDRIHGSVAAAVIAVQNGASIVRTHDVAATADALKVLRAVFGEEQVSS
ncbi:MAG: dihydropteroate synthase [Gammaproteobacteria bacterium]|nr:dihydropteroate synthase [Gammaproteobacteria bacterium]MCZ6856227.1 dihydropteroate synthase [Gammaproteobacteria bacterium]